MIEARSSRGLTESLPVYTPKVSTVCAAAPDVVFMATMKNPMISKGVAISALELGLPSSCSPQALLFPSTELAEVNDQRKSTKKPSRPPSLCQARQRSSGVGAPAAVLQLHKLDFESRDGSFARHEEDFAQTSLITELNNLSSSVTSICFLRRTGLYPSRSNQSCYCCLGH